MGQRPFLHRTRVNLIAFRGIRTLGNFKVGFPPRKAYSVNLPLIKRHYQKHHAVIGAKAMGLIICLEKPVVKKTA
jgi:hypothetical protein